ncbi:MAG: orotidine-5'-phosphate decarboxylase [Alphaproteobacteria bacterium GM202ARS2]|nr:orotidine-5'-phosphate decarboxylase [Alphaproteobacteria bacterium GM202ARS2]
MTMQERLIVALDESLDESRAIIEELGDHVQFYKIGWRCFLQGNGAFVSDVVAAGKGKRVFLDLKIHDIDVTVEKAMASLPRDVSLTTLYGTGATVRAAREGRNGHGTPALLLLTWLSSLDEADFHGMGGQGSLRDFVVARAIEAYEAGGEGVIASGEHVGAIRSELAKTYGKDADGFLLVVPGVRLAGGDVHEHKRSLTPYEAVRAGADYLVMGRPVARSPRGKRVEVVERIFADMARADRERHRDTAGSSAAW